MKKCILSIMLSLAMMVSLLPIPAMAISASEEITIQTIVEKTLKDYSKSVYYTDADDDAFSDFFKHGFFGGGKKMILKENSAMVSALFNSCLLQEALCTAISNGLSTAMQLNETSIHIDGTLGWHNYFYSYFLRGYNKEGTDFSNDIGVLASTKDGGGQEVYAGGSNKFDEVLELLAGSVKVNVAVKRISSTGENSVYEIQVKVSDVFDFTGTYEDIADKGYNTSKDDALVNMGVLMNTIGLKPFDWIFQKSFEIEVPNGCSHGYADYCWRYDSVNRVLQSVQTDEFSSNQTTPISGKEKPGYYFQLEKTVQLKHDLPWVIEYDLLAKESLRVSQISEYSRAVPGFLQDGCDGLWLHFVERITLQEGQPDGEGEMVYSRSNNVGQSLGFDETAVGSEYITYRIENRISSDGSNMFYVTAFLTETGEILCEAVPLSKHLVKSSLDNKTVVSDRNSNYTSGMDLAINYVGNQDFPLDNSDFVLRIWENGKDLQSDLKKTVDPTCTEKGGKLYFCNDCGCEYLKDIIPALGHSYEEYSFDNNATCTADGTKTRTCTVCGAKDTVTAPDTATGHSYKAVVTEPTYTEQGYTTYICTGCGDSYKDDYTDVKQHKYVPEVTAPTCMEQGYTAYTCSECGDSYVDDYTESVDHTPVIDPAVKPTCSEKGKTEGSHCGVCGYVIKKQALISTNNSHSMEESVVTMPTYDTPGRVAYVCKDCGKTDYMEIPPLTKPAPVNPFTDVMEADWFYEPVLWAVAENVTGGKTATTFAPNEGCTRAQVVTFLWAANGKPEPKSMNNSFTDVSADAWYLKSVLWAVEQGITSGISATEFGPEQTCTRAQIVTFLYAAEKKPAVDGKSTFTDVVDSDWFAVPVIWAAENNITGGIGEGKFGPNDTCTRAQVVTFLYKVYGNK